MLGKKRFAMAAIFGTGLALVTLTGCPSTSSDTSVIAPPIPAPPTTLSPSLGTAGGSGQDTSLASLIPPNWNTSGCAWFNKTNSYWTVNPNAEYDCSIDLGDNGGAAITGETISSDQWSSHQGYAGTQALQDWINNQSQALTIQQVSSITDCPTTDATVACEFPWSSPSYPGSSDQVGLLVFVNTAVYPEADLLWAIPSQDALFDIAANADSQDGDLGTQTWFLQNVEGQ
jgi:hypothetical protein